MSWPFSIFMLLISVVSVFSRNHRLNVFLAITSIMADTFIINVGGLNLLLINIIGFLTLPYCIRSGAFNKKFIRGLVKPFTSEYLYLIVLGIIFGFIFPWQDLTGTRLWNQNAQGRAIVSLIRIANEFLILFYFALLIYNKKISIDFIIYSFAITSVISFWVGFIDYLFGYPLKDILFDLVYFERERFLGLNGEPKALGREGAFAFAIVILYMLYYKSKSVFLKFSLFTNFIAVLLSSSASAFILFVLLNLSVLFNFNLKNLILSVITITAFVVLINYMPNLHQDTLLKVDKAIFGAEDYWATDEPEFIKRFDIFDRLALLYLWEHPFYIMTGVGPNLISIPASINVPKSTIFYTMGRIDSVPNVLINNVISRSGLIGLTLLVLGLLKLYTHSKSELKPFYTKLLTASIIFSMVYFNIVFYLVIGILIGSVLLKRKEIQPIDK